MEIRSLSLMLLSALLTLGVGATVDAAGRKPPRFRPPAIVPAPKLPPPPPSIEDMSDRAYCFVSPVSYFQTGEKRMKRVSTLSTQRYADTARITVEETEVPPDSEVEAAAKRNEIIASSIQVHWKDGSYVRDNSDFGKAKKAVFTDERTGEVQRFGWIWTQTKSKKRKLSAVKTVPQGVAWREGACPEINPSM